MSESKPSKVFMFDGADPEMQGAKEKARATFRYFWREIAWERRRIVPGLDMACVKAPFSDGDGNKAASGKPRVEEMWLRDVDFDGRIVTGVLLNSPNWLKSVHAGDTVRLPLNTISDWMYAIRHQVYGAFTVNQMRSRMSPKELAAHDRAWGLEFGDPTEVKIVPAPPRKTGVFSGLFAKRNDAPATGPIGEHPMSENMAQPLRDQLAKDPSTLSHKDARGWTLLHHQALAGSLATVRVLLEHGADPNAATHDKTTPLQLAKSLNWTEVTALLEAKGAR